MQLELKPFQELIAIVRTLPNSDLYLCGEYPWHTDTLGIIYKSEKGLKLEDSDPEFVQEHHLYYIIESAALEDVILNAHLQKPYVTLSEIVAAFNHYFRYDGFMTLE